MDLLRKDEYELAIEWGRSGIFGDARSVVNPDFAGASLVLLNCINDSKAGAGLRAAVGGEASEIDEFLRSENRQHLEREFAFYLRVGTPEQLARIGRSLRVHGEIELASIALTAALERTYAAPGVRRGNSFWKSPGLTWASKVRSELAEVEFALGATETARLRSGIDLALRTNQGEGASLLPSRSVAARALYSDGKVIASESALKELFTGMKNEREKLDSTSLFARPKDLINRLSVDLSLLIRASYESAGAGMQRSDSSQFAVAFEAVQFAGTGQVSQAYEDMEVRRLSTKLGSGLIDRSFQDSLESYRERMATLELQLLETLGARASVSGESVSELAELGTLRSQLVKVSDAIRSAGVDEFSRIKARSVAELQESLAGDEALIIYFEAPPFGNLGSVEFLWVVNSTDAVWIALEPNSSSLKDRVDRLRCGLDVEQAMSSNCQGGGGAGRPGAQTSAGSNGLPVFDIELAHELFETLFPGDVRPFLREKLRVVPSPSLVALPFTALVQSSSDLPIQAADFKKLDVPWLLVDHSIQILPAPTALSAKINGTATPIDEVSLIAFGNPLLSGKPDVYPIHEKWARAAAVSNECAGQSEWQAGPFIEKLDPGNDVRVEYVESMLSLTPLISTVFEVCDFQQRLAPRSGKVFLGRNARESVVKEMNNTGELKRISVFHFATHGILEADLKGISEPGLVFSPPEISTRSDDGFLSASEISGLNLDADLVILSACNTALGSSRSGKALTGLAGAFFKAGAHSLIVTHWATVSFASSVILSEMGKSGRAGLDAESLRSAQLLLAREYRIHPTLWAQFFVVGQAR